MKILIADDDVASRTILTMLLEKSGHNVITAGNGLDAHEILCSDERPEMAILDWLMPGMDGAEICRSIRKQETGLPVYLIMLTIKGEKSDIIEGLESGANDYISKPYDPGELHARIRSGERILHLQRELSDRVLTLEKNDRRIRELLSEKDRLLYEAHHRIRSNMELIMSMLTLQAESGLDEKATKAVANTASRMRTLALVYEKIYHSEFLERYTAGTYIMHLVDEITRAFPDRGKVNVHIDADPIEFDINALVKIGMIINELTENAMVHAFTGRETGTINIEVHRNDRGICLTFKDDGVGLPAKFDAQAPETFGFRLINGICSEMSTKMRVDSGQGTSITIEFPQSRDGRKKAV